jgi:hypothetical protein
MDKFIKESFELLGCNVKYLPLENSPGVFVHYISNEPLKVRTALQFEDFDTTKQFWKEASVKILSILSNGITFDSSVRNNQGTIKEFIDTYYINLSPEEKLDSILEYIGSLTSYDGQAIVAPLPNTAQVVKHYFKNAQEWKFYQRAAIQADYIKVTIATAAAPSMYSLTIKGLTRLIKVKEGRDSRFCFVAMAFTVDMFLIYQEAIEPAIRHCGFEPYIVNNENIDSDKTINDSILAGIKKSRFTIADFTYHKSGVYFEAGFALGRGQKVIYSCQEDDMVKAHFDIRNYQHIVWQKSEDFKKKLIDKIEAFIKD